MALTALGSPPRFARYPLDPADFNRCLKLIKSAPEVRGAFPAIRSLDSVWEKLIDHWDELQALFVEEVGWDWSKARSAPKTYDRMQELRAQADPDYAQMTKRAASPPMETPAPRPAALGINQPKETK